MHNIQAFTGFVGEHQLIVYLLIFIGLVFEGEFFIIATGVLAHLGALNFWIALGFILAGGIAKTILGYHIGRVLYRNWHNAKFLRFVEKRVHHFLPHFRKKPFWSIFLSKFIIGANHLVILFSGFERVNYRKFLTAEGVATAIWAPGLLALGYFFSYTALRVSGEIGKFSLIILLFIVVFIILDKLFGWLYQLFEEIYGYGNGN